MTDTIGLAASERAKYDKVWLIPEYRQACHSVTLWQQRRELFPSNFTSALDIGCGLGRIIGMWREIGIDAWGVDISSNAVNPTAPYRDRIILGCLWRKGWLDRISRAHSGRFDFGICTDVMEHIPTECVTDVLTNIAECCNEVLFKIAHEHNTLGGEVLHLTLQPARWWVKQMRSITGKATHLGTHERSGCQDSLIRWVVK